VLLAGAVVVVLLLEDWRTGLPAMAPFSDYRLSQHYLYEEGRLEETVELVDNLGATDERVWVRIDETA